MHALHSALQAFKAAVAQVGGGETDEALAYNVEGSAGETHIVFWNMSRRRASLI